MKQIICLSHSPWHANPSRTYQLLSRFKNGRIIFFDPPLSGNGEHHWRDEGQQVAKNVTLHGSPPKGKTAESRRFFNKAYQKRLASHVAAVMRDYAFDKPLLWLTEPYSADFVGKMSHGAVIYDYQELACAETTRKDALRAALAAELLRKADVVIGQTKSACDTLRAANECAVLVPNGVDYALFSRAASANLAFPDDLFTVKNPIFGHIGAISEQVDLSLPAAAAKARPEWSFVFIGEYSTNEYVTELTALPNVRFLGPKPQKQLPNYINRFDVCMNLYKASEMSRDISPMKLYEYLASGKPVVSTPQPAQALDYADVIYIAGSPAEFAESCRKAVTERDKWKVAQRANYALAASWDARVAELERALTERGIL